MDMRLNNKGDIMKIHKWEDVKHKNACNKNQDSCGLNDDELTKEREKALSLMSEEDKKIFLEAEEKELKEFEALAKAMKSYKIPVGDNGPDSPQ